MKKILILENSKKLNQVLTTHQKTEKIDYIVKKKKKKKKKNCQLSLWSG